MKRVCLLLIFVSLLFTSNAQIDIQYVMFDANDGSEQWSIEVVSPSTNIVKYSLDEVGNVTVKLVDSKNQSILRSFTSSNPSGLFTTRYSYSVEEEREALMEIYRELGGDNWRKKDNWGTDKPVSEWYGISAPEIQGKQGTVKWISLEKNNLVGKLPIAAFEKLKNLRYLFLSNNDIRGDVPECLTKLYGFSIANNVNLSSHLPEHPWSELMSYVCDGRQLDFSCISNNADVPKWAENHERFCDFWHNFALLSVTKTDNYKTYWKNLKIPMTEFQIIDFDGNVHNNSDFSKNKLTLLMHWESWCMYSKDLVQKLIPVYERLHGKGLEILGYSTLCSGGAIPCVDEEAHFEYIKEVGIPWKNCSQTRENCIINFNGYDMNPPKVYAVDNSGNIVFQSITNGYSELIPFIEEFFSE